MEKLKQQARGARTKLTKLGSWFRRHLAFSIILGTVVLAFIGSLIFVTVYYRDKAAPGVTIANIQVGGQTKEQVVDSLANLIKNMRLSLTYGGKSATASADDLGINIDTDKLADEATQTGQGNPFSVVLTHKHFDLTGSYDKEKVQSFITTNFPELTTDPIDAQVVYDKNQNKYTTQPGAVGKSVKLDELYAKVENMLRNPGLANYEIATSDDNPTISNESAQATTNQLNNTLSQSIQIVNNGRVIWTLDPWDEASWISLSANPATGQYDISYDLDKIKGFVSDTIVDQLPDKPVNQQAITNANGEIYQVVTPGRNGQVASNTDEVANQIKDKLSSAAGGQINLATKDAPYGTDKWVTTNGGHWVEANLSTYEVKLYDGKNVVWSTNQTSHGKASTPTITGLFKVWHKVEGQCMPNPPSTQPLCHIRKVTYFEKSGYAFHEAWWMSAANGNVRQGISHGCINMYYEDAKRVYDWSPIGTPVWVHW